MNADGISSESANEQTKALGPLLTRRTFFAGTVAGALTFIGARSFGGGTILAYADEGGELVFKILVANREEIPVIALDMSTASPVALPGVQVTLTSREVEGATASATTDEDGLALINIRPLSTDKDITKQSYTALASAVAKKDGYRLFEEERILAVSGVPSSPDEGVPNLYVVCTAPLVDGQPYLSRLTLDEVDLQFWTPEMPVHPSNDFAHELRFTLRNTTADVQWVAYLLDGETVFKQTQPAKADASGVLDITISDLLFNGTVDHLKAGNTINFRLVGTTSGSSTETVLKGAIVKLVENIYMMFDNPLDEGHSISLFAETPLQDNAKPDPGQSSPIGKWMENHPATLNLNFAILPLKFYSTLDGSFGFALELASFPIFHSSFGKFTKDCNWKTIRDKCGKNGWPAYKAKINEQRDWYVFTKSAAPMASDYKRYMSPLLPNYSLGLSVELMGQGKPTFKSGQKAPVQWDAEFEAKLSVAGSFEATTYATAGFIPLHVSFDFSLQTAFMVAVGAVWTLNNGTPSIEYTPAFKQHSTVLLYAELGLSLGVGIRHLLAAGIRGSGWLKCVLDFDPTRESRGEGKFFKPTVQIGARVQAYVEVLLFSKTISIRELGSKTLVPKDSNDEEMPITFENENRYGTNIVEIDESADADPLDGFKFIGNSALLNVIEGIISFDSNDEPVFAYKPANGTNDFGPIPECGFESPYSADSLDLAFNPVHGIRPTVEHRILESVFLSPHMRAAEAENGNVALLRLGVVLIDGEPRTRFMRSVYYPAARVWDDPMVIEPTRCETKQTKEARKNWHDVALEVAKWDDSQIDLAISSVAATSLEAGLAATIEDVKVATAPLFNNEDEPAYSKVGYWELRESSHVRGAKVSNARNSTTTFWSYYDEANKKYSIKTSHSEVFDGDLTVEGIRLSDVLSRGVFDAYDGINDEYSYDSETGNLTDPSKFNRFGTQRKPIIVGMLPDSGADTCTAVLFVAPDYKKEQSEDPDAAQQAFAPIKFEHVLQVIYFGREIIVEDNQEFGTKTRFLVTMEEPGGKGNRTHKVCEFEAHRQVAKEPIPIPDPDPESPDKYADPNTYTYAVKSYDVDFSRTNILGFVAAEDGKHLYGYRCMEGYVPGNDDDLASVAADDDAIFQGTSCPFASDYAANPAGDANTSRYQILEARWSEEFKSFFEFYPIADLQEPIDSLQLLRTDEKSMTFISMCITDADRARGDVYMIEVPHVMGMHVCSVKPVMRMALQGQICYMDVEIANTGNIPISGFHVKLVEESPSAVLIDEDFTDLTSHIQPVTPSGAYVEEGIDELIDVDETNEAEDPRDKAGVVWPGKTRTFRFGFKVPNEAHGETSFSATMSNPVCAEKYKAVVPQDEGTAQIMAVEDDSYQLMVDPREHPMSIDLVAVDDSVSADSLEDLYSSGDCTWTIETTGGEGGGGGGGNTPKTGDSSGLLAGAALALGAGAAGVAWYEKRRADNERETPAE